MPQMTPSLLILFLFASSLQYFAYRRRAGFKNERKAKLFFYEQLIGAATVSFFVWHPLDVISPTVQFAAGLAFIVGGLVAIYFLHTQPVIK